MHATETQWRYCTMNKIMINLFSQVQTKRISCTWCTISHIIKYVILKTKKKGLILKEWIWIRYWNVTYIYKIVWYYILSSIKSVLIYSHHWIVLNTVRHYEEWKGICTQITARLGTSPHINSFWRHFSRSQWLYDRCPSHCQKSLEFESNRLQSEERRWSDFFSLSQRGFLCTSWIRDWRWLREKCRSTSWQ